MDTSKITAESLLGGLIKELAKESKRPPLNVIGDSIPEEFRKHSFFREFVLALESLNVVRWDEESMEFKWITD